MEACKCTTSFLIRIIPIAGDQQLPNRTRRYTCEQNQQIWFRPKRERQSANSGQTTHLPHQAPRFHAITDSGGRAGSILFRRVRVQISARRPLILTVGFLAFLWTSGQMQGYVKLEHESCLPRLFQINSH